MKHYYRRRIAVLFSAALLLLANISGVAFPQLAHAVNSDNNISLNFNSLPSAQGWIYSTGDASVDTDFYSVDGTRLHMDTIGSGFSGHAYIRNTPIDQQTPFVLSVRARVTNYEEQSDGRNPYGFDLSVFTGSEQFELAISPVGIKGGLAEPGDTTPDHVFSSTIDVTQFHDYRIEGVPGGRFEVFVDDVSLGTALPAPVTSPSMLYFGDGTAGANAQADITSYSFTQAAPPVADYTVCLLYDATKVHKKGSTVPVKIQLCDANNTNMSSASIMLTAQGVTQTSTAISGPVQDSGNANPDNNFRFEETLGVSGGYIYNLSTKTLQTGSYTLSFTVGTNPTVYTVPFQVQ